MYITKCSIAKFFIFADTLQSTERRELVFNHYDDFSQQTMITGKWNNKVCVQDISKAYLLVAACKERLPKNIYFF